MDFPERLKKIVKKTGLKREEFAEKAGVSRAQFFNYLSGKHEPNFSFFRNIKEAFQWVDLEWLIMGKDPTEVAEHASPYTPPSPVVKRIDIMLADMDEEAQRDVLKYAEKAKCYAEMMSERHKKRG